MKNRLLKLMMPKLLPRWRNWDTGSSGMNRGKLSKLELQRQIHSDEGWERVSLP